MSNSRPRLRQSSQSSNIPPAGYRIETTSDGLHFWVHEESGEGGFKSWDRGLVIYGAWKHEQGMVV